MSTGLRREEFRSDSYRTVYNVDGGPGVTVTFFNDGLLYAFLMGEVKAGSGLQNGYSAGAGGAVGFLKPVSSAWKMIAEAKALSFVAGDVHNVYSVDATARYTINANSAIKINLKRERFDGFYSTDASIGWNGYW